MRRNFAILSVMFLLPLAVLAARPDGDTGREKDIVNEHAGNLKIMQRAPRLGLKENKSVRVEGRHSAEHAVPKKKPVAKIKPKADAPETELPND